MHHWTWLSIIVAIFLTTAIILRRVGLELLVGRFWAGCLIFSVITIYLENLVQAHGAWTWNYELILNRMALGMDGIVIEDMFLYPLSYIAAGMVYRSIRNWKWAGLLGSEGLSLIRYAAVIFPFSMVIELGALVIGVWSKGTSDTWSYFMIKEVLFYISNTLLSYALLSETYFPRLQPGGKMLWGIVAFAGFGFFSVIDMAGIEVDRYLFAVTIPGILAGIHLGFRNRESRFCRSATPQLSARSRGLVNPAGHCQIAS
jgi:hypothetical protein